MRREVCDAVRNPRLPKRKQEERRQRDDRRGKRVHAVRGLVITGLRLRVRVALDEDTDEQLQHIGERQPAGKQEQPFRRVEVAQCPFAQKPDSDFLRAFH